MRRYQAVWRLKQWIILFDRLRGHHIQSGCRYFSALQRVRQIDPATEVFDLIRINEEPPRRLFVLLEAVPAKIQKFALPALC